MSLRISDEERDAALKPERAVSRIPAGHWRNVFEFIHPSCVDVERARQTGCIELAAGVWLYPIRHVSREMAEQRGRESVRVFNQRWAFQVMRYLRAEFFPGEPP